MTVKVGIDNGIEEKPMVFYRGQITAADWYKLSPHHQFRLYCEQTAKLYAIEKALAKESQITQSK